MARHQVHSLYRLAAVLSLLGGMWPSPANSFLPVVPSTRSNGHAPTHPGSPFSRSLLFAKTKLADPLTSTREKSRDGRSTPTSTTTLSPPPPTSSAPQRALTDVGKPIGKEGVDAGEGGRNGTEPVNVLEGASVRAVLEDVLLLADRALDTIEDVGVHLRRVTERDLAKRFKIAKLTNKQEDKPRILVLGTGWAAHAMAKIIDADMYEVVIVSPRNFFVFTPMLAGSSVGTVEYRSICEPIRQANPYCDYYEATCEEIFPHNKTIRVVTETRGHPQETFMVPYDTLVYAVGAQSTTFNIPGAREHCYFLKEVSDAIQLRTAIVDAFERANMPSVPIEEKKRILSFVVVGGGPTGIEFAGEFSDFLKRDLARFYPRLVDLVTFKIIQSMDRILPLFSTVLQESGLRSLQDQGIEVLLKKRVVEVTDDVIKLKSGESIPYGLCVWAAGTGPREVTKRLISQIPEQADSPSGQRGKLSVDPWLRVKGTNGTILSLGDCADVDPEPLPATGQVAAQQGAYVARILNRGYQLNTTTPSLPGKMDPLTFLANWLRVRGRVDADPFKFLNLGLLAYIGETKALAQVQTGDAIKLGQAAGVAGFALWRSVYLVKQVSTRNRILVLFDWMKSRVFGRDITRL